MSLTDSPSSSDPAVGVILADCLELLEEIATQYRGDPEGEYRRLLMLALEREQLVSYAYREDILLRRIQGLVASPEVVTIFHHAFTQIWRDEEAHTVLMRGSLIQGRSLGSGLRTMTEQAAGLLAGWSSALKHHVPRSDAPFRTLFVDGIAIGARAVGKLSPDLRAELGLKTFKEFCVYNVDAEETAEVCWRRLIELDIQLDKGNRVVYERIAREEREHRDVFAAVAACLDEHDWVKPHALPELISEELAAIGDRFALPEFRAASPQLFGRAAPVHVIGGVDDKLAAGDAALDVLDIDLSGLTVAIKPSWMMGYSLDDTSSITDPALLGHIVNRLKERGAAEVILLEGENLYSGLFQNREVHSVATHFGYDKIDCEIVDAARETVPPSSTNVLGPTQLSKRWVDADIRISITRLRSHPTEHIHGCVGNLEGLIVGASDEVFWTRSYVHSVAGLAVAIDAPPHLSIIDAWDDCPDGLFGIMAGSQTCDPKRVYVSTDALCCDLIALRHTGSARGITSPTLRRAVELFGDPRTDIEVRGIDTEIDDWRNPYRNMVSGFMADLSFPFMAYLSGSGTLFAPPMDSKFVEAKRPPGPVRAIRAVARRVLGLHPPKS